MKRLSDSGIRYFHTILIILAILCTSYSCTKDSIDDKKDPAGGSNPDLKGPGANEVWIQSSAFTPVTITVTSGTTITWTNKDGMLHTVTSNTGLFDSGNISIGGTYSFKFNAAGTFSYHCELHPTMTAKAVVN